MAESSRFRLIYHSRLKDHLRAIDLKYHSLIRQTIEQQLLFEPDIETRNRKPLRESIGFDATWEIRLGPGNRFRVFYDVDRESRTATILAVGEKRGNRLMIAGEEM